MHRKISFSLCFEIGWGKRELSSRLIFTIFRNVLTASETTCAAIRLLSMPTRLRSKNNGLGKREYNEEKACRNRSSEFSFSFLYFFLRTIFVFLSYFASQTEAKCTCRPIENKTNALRFDALLEIRSLSILNHILWRQNEVNNNNETFGINYYYYY